MSEPNYEIRRVYPPDILSPSFDMDAYRAELLEDHAEHMRKISEGHKATWHIQTGERGIILKKKNKRKDPNETDNT